MDLNENDILVPLDVPKAERENYIHNYLAITQKCGRLMSFAGDQKIEHLNNDFYGEGIHPDDGDPEHLFRMCNAIHAITVDGKTVNEAMKIYTEA